LAGSGTPSDRSERRLAAIMFTDIVGYTALMAESEERGVRDRHRALVRPLVAECRGKGNGADLHMLELTYTFR
jgi:class 3 adenylate cyclase